MIDTGRILENVLKLSSAEEISSSNKYFIKYAMKEAINKAIDLCAEFAELKFDEAGRMRVDTESILRIKEMVK